MTTKPLLRARRAGGIALSSIGPSVTGAGSISSRASSKDPVARTPNPSGKKKACTSQLEPVLITNSMQRTLPPMNSDGPTSPLYSGYDPVIEPPSEYVLMMLSKTGSIVARTTEHISTAVLYGDLMVDNHQAITFDVFERSPNRRYIPRNEYHLQS